jgi:hypothetical protein
MTCSPVLVSIEFLAVNMSIIKHVLIILASVNLQSMRTAACSMPRLAQHSRSAGGVTLCNHARHEHSLELAPRMVLMMVRSNHISSILSYARNDKTSWLAFQNLLLFRNGCSADLSRDGRAPHSSRMVSQLAPPANPSEGYCVLSSAFTNTAWCQQLR